MITCPEVASAAAATVQRISPTPARGETESPGSSGLREIANPTSLAGAHGPPSTDFQAFIDSPTLWFGLTLRT